MSAVSQQSVTNIQGALVELYQIVGARIERPKRGTRSRPTVAETVAYRAHIDEQMQEFLKSVSDRGDGETILAIVRLGLEHEMQHQELLVYDIKHLLCDQFDAPIAPSPRSVETVTGMTEVEGGLFELGYAGDDFAFDNEKPQHKVFLQDFSI